MRKLILASSLIIALVGCNSAEKADRELETKYINYCARVVNSKASDNPYYGECAQVFGLKN